MRGQVCDRVLRFLEVARRDDDRGSGRCQPPSHAEPDAAIAAGHHGDLSAQIEQLCPPVSPDCVLARIERLVAGPYLELFARETKVGWQCLSDQSGMGPDIAGALPNAINIIVDGARIAKIKPPAT